jgi:hypothetical protein
MLTSRNGDAFFDRIGTRTNSLQYRQSAGPCLMLNKLKLYNSAASPKSGRVRIFLAEKGIAIPLVPVDLAKGGATFRCLTREQRSAQVHSRSDARELC